MKPIKPRLLASTNSLERLLEMVNKYFYTNTIQLGSNGEVLNSKGRLNNFQWRYKSGRYRFESISL